MIITRYYCFSILKNRRLPEVGRRLGNDGFAFTLNRMMARFFLAMVFVVGLACKAPAAPNVPIPTNDQAWKVLPKAEKGAGQPLPAWIRALANSLPKTAAAMIDLDYAQRVESPLPPKLRAKLRWIAAHANRSDYGMAIARADYWRSGGKVEDIENLLADLPKLPEEERLALELVRQLTLAAYQVTDAQVEKLVKIHGEKQVVAIVLVAAYANFQDRIIHALGIEVVQDGPLPPIEVRFAKQPGQEKRQRKFSPKAGKPPMIATKIEDPDWVEVPFDALREKLASQVNRHRARIAIPEANPQLPSPISWVRLNHGYQPRLTSAWIGGLRAFKSETDLPEVEQETMFWVVTRSLQCFY